MESRLMTFLKTSDFPYFIYYHLFSSLFKVLGLFIKTDENLILFNSFGGKKYDDSPKEIFETMLNDERCSNFKYVWAFHEPEKFNIKNAKKIKTDSMNYFINALKARCWVTNSSIERGLNFKKKNTFCFNTWHGSPLKTMGSDKIKNNNLFKVKYCYNIDLMNAQSIFDVVTYSKCFNLAKEKFIISGLPRNDVLADHSEHVKLKMKEKLGIPKEKKVILYAPTFREYDRDEKKNCLISPPVDFYRWQHKLGDEYFVLFRAHYEVSKLLNIVSDNCFIRDVSTYPCLNELMLASDLLISDYSSIFMDYSILERPMLCFAYDFEKYLVKRGINIDLNKEFQHGAIKNEYELINIIKNLNFNECSSKTVAFKNKYIESYGSAAKLSVDRIIAEVSLS